MKTTTILATAVLALLMTTPPLRAEDSDKAKCACMKEQESKMKAMKMKAVDEAAELEKLVDEMNSSVGEKKLEVMTALINKMVQTHKAMCEKMSKDPSATGGTPAPAEEVQKAADPTQLISTERKIITFRTGRTIPFREHS